VKVFDGLVIGGGQAGPFLAAKLAARGEHIAVIEKESLGGTCVNRGCTPTKTLRKSARVAYLARRASEFGVEVGPVRVDFKAAMARMHERVETSRTGLTSWIEGISGISLYWGEATIVGRDDEGRFRVAIAGTDEVLITKRVFLNTGTRASVPSIPGIAEAGVMTNVELLQLTELPPRLLILGGSYIGLEMAQIFRRLGSEVQIVEVGERVIAQEDADVSAAILAMLQAEGITFHLGAGVESVARDAGGIVLRLEGGGRVHGSHLLAASGRVPNTAKLGLETIGVAVDDHGWISTNARLETNVPGVFALGDINRRGAFMHTSVHDHEIVAENLAGGSRSADARVMTYALFTDPPLGHVGIHEHEAKELVRAGRRISMAEIQMAQVSRAKEESETLGLMRFWIDDDTDHFLGASLLGINADEIVQSIGLVMASKGTAQIVMEALPVHPTVTEFLPTILARRRPVVA